jgi:hypothetical protein
MAFRNVAGSFRTYTTTQITALVAAFGPTGTQEVNAIKPGTVVFDTTANMIKVFNGTAFIATAALA